LTFYNYNYRKYKKERVMKRVMIVLGVVTVLVSSMIVGYGGGEKKYIGKYVSEDTVFDMSSMSQIYQVLEIKKDGTWEILPHLWGESSTGEWKVDKDGIVLYAGRSRIPKIIGEIEGNLLIDRLSGETFVRQEREEGSYLIPLEEGTYEKAQGFKGTVYEGLFHLGRDYCVKKAGENEDGSLHGTTVYPISEGIVVDLRFNKYPAKDPEKWKNGDGVGNYVTINHGNGIVAVYMHLAKVEVSRDQKVTAQTPLGEAGDIILHPEVPGKMCPHFHLEIRKTGVTSLHVPPNQRYGYISQDGTTKIEKGERIENVLEWIDLNFYDPDSILATRKASPDSARGIFTEQSVITTPKVETEVKVVKEPEIVSDEKVYTVQVGGFQ
jgi:hypothetical protein